MFLKSELVTENNIFDIYNRLKKFFLEVPERTGFEVWYDNHPNSGFNTIGKKGSESFLELPPDSINYCEDEDDSTDPYFIGIAFYKGDEGNTIILFEDNKILFGEDYIIIKSRSNLFPLCIKYKKRNLTIYEYNLLLRIRNLNEGRGEWEDR